MRYKLFIPAAGTGSRLGTRTRHLNKALIPVGGKPAISWILERVPASVPVVVALGHGGDYLAQFLSLAYPERRFELVRVTPFEGPGSGLGHTLRTASASLQCPFVFWACDTLVPGGKVPAPDRNWLACAPVQDASAYRTVDVARGRIRAIREKKRGAGERLAYIGLAGIHDHVTFWKAMRGNARALEQGEVVGLRRLTDARAIALPWLDTGTPETLARARRELAGADAPHILEKDGEAIWFLEDRVLKFSIDETFIRNRARRASLLEGFVPPVTAVSRNFYVYPKAAGEVLSRSIDPRVARELWRFLDGFWKPRALSATERAAFRARCLAFYRDKTQQRLARFFELSGRPDRSERINGEDVPALSELLGRVDWNTISDGVACRMHGDLHFENILRSAPGRFVLLDWRQDFAGSLDYGDLYYDLAKLKHGMIMSHQVADEKAFRVEDLAPGEVRFDFYRREILVQCEREFEQWLDGKGFDRARVAVLTALVFLNICALHEFPYGELLYYLGKLELHRALAARAAVREAA